MGHSTPGALGKYGRTDRHVILDNDSGGSTEPCIRCGCRSFERNGQFLAVVQAIQKHSQSLLQRIAVALAAKGIIQSPITSCSRWDHSICQAITNSIGKISGRRRCGLIVARDLLRLQSVMSTIASFLFCLCFVCKYVCVYYTGILDLQNFRLCFVTVVHPNACWAVVGTNILCWL